MLFSSITFLFYFLPIVMILYAVVPGRLKNVVILISSLFFYAWGEPRYVILMAATICTGYVFGILIDKSVSGHVRRTWVVLTIIVSLGILGYFKYADFFISNFNRVTGVSAPLLYVALPIGISFYTFQMLSYVIDVYRGDVKACKNIITFAAYISMFPQLIAGPIVRYRDISRQLVHRTHSIEKISYGIRRFVIGLGKKVLLANTLGELVACFKDSSEKTVLFVWMYAIAVTLQIYYDFSGYSDMAIGLGSIMGFEFPENFNYPMLSKSLTEFWRRWHMTLGNWFRDYLYIPLGGSRVSVGRWIFNIWIVWIATGLWHGANWNFVIWGIYFAVFLVLEKLFLRKILEQKKFRVFGRIYFILLITISFVIFDGTVMCDIWMNIKTMFGFGHVSVLSMESVFFLKDYLWILMISMIGSTGLPIYLLKRIQKNEMVCRISQVLEPIMIVLLLIACTAFLVNGSFNPFLYFRF